MACEAMNAAPPAPQPTEAGRVTPEQWQALIDGAHTAGIARGRLEALEERLGLAEAPVADEDDEPVPTRGTDAIVRAWNDLPPSLRLAPELINLFEAVKTCRDVDAPAAEAPVAEPVAQVEARPNGDKLLTFCGGFDTSSIAVGTKLYTTAPSAASVPPRPEPYQPSSYDWEWKTQSERENSRAKRVAEIAEWDAKYGYTRASSSYRLVAVVGDCWGIGGPTVEWWGDPPTTGTSLYVEE